MPRESVRAPLLKHNSAQRVRFVSCVVRERAAAESLAATIWRAMGARSESEARGFFMNAVRKELSMSFWTALARHRQNRLDFVGISRADVQRMRDQNQRGFGMGGRVRGRHGPVVAPGPRVAPPGWARPSDLRAFCGLPGAWRGDLERAGCLRGWGFTVRTGCVGGLDGWEA